ncbi:MAG TPA: hypothetical protein VKA46_43000 [Gemmataceae bacterium]|nr:hypothetical protein [Gemmataceae bacterium]
MAGRILNRMDLRRQAELAEERGPRAPEREADVGRGSASRRSSGPRDQGRVCARWGVFDGAMTLVETFDYNQRAQAERRVAELNAARKNGTTYFLQVVKEAMPPAGSVDLD